MKRIGSRLLVISAVSLAVFLSIRKQYNTAQTILQEKLLPGPAIDKIKDEEMVRSLAQEVEKFDVHFSLEDNSQGQGFRSRNVPLGNWVEGQKKVSSQLYEGRIIDDNGPNEDKDIGDLTEEEDIEEDVFYDSDANPTMEPKTLIDAIGEYLRLPGHKNNKANTTGESDEGYDEYGKADIPLENATGVFKDLQIIDTAPEIDNVDNANDNAKTFITKMENGDEPAVVISEITVTPIMSHDATETVSDIPVAKDVTDDLIKEYDEYMDKDKLSYKIVYRESLIPFERTVTEIPQQEIAENIDQQDRDISLSGKWTNAPGIDDSVLRVDQSVKPKPTSGSSSMEMKLVGEGYEKVSNHDWKDPLEQPNVKLQMLLETLTPGVLSAILNHQLSPEMANNLRNKLMMNLGRVWNDGALKSSKAPELQRDEITSIEYVLASPKPDANNVATLRPAIGENGFDSILESEVNITDDNTAHQNETDSIFSEVDMTSYGVTTASRVNFYDNPKPLSESEYSLLRTKSSASSNQESVSSPPDYNVKINREIDFDPSRRYVDYSANKSEEPILPKWMNFLLQNEHISQNSNGNFENHHLVNNHVFSRSLLDGQLGNTFPELSKVKADPFDSNDLKETSKSISEVGDQQLYKDVYIHGNLFDHIVPTDEPLRFQQLSDSWKTTDQPYLQQINNPGQPGQSYQDILRQQKVQIDKSVDSISSNDILTPLDTKVSYREGKEDCPREVKLGETSHPVTALVTFPGEDTAWIRRILEQLFGETTDDLYEITADLKSGNARRVLQMSRNIAIQTHSVRDKNFERALVVIRNPYSVEERHQVFRPDSIDWQKQYLWGDTYVSWLSSDLPLHVVVYEDLVESPLTELIKIADFLSTIDRKVNYKCAMAVADKPPNMIYDLRQITGIYFSERKNINNNIDKVLQVAQTKFPELVDRLDSYKV
ncbi:WSCD family member [Biomphalaria pfeifferi]|uniref:WSCD family member n=1 Tax=Biomphalaria pfeifferi TaxID=112525 RepID=A0AAD8BEZ3_BIOPF|nr:WSCD family member [Biomphalaria pfeifferi]